MNNTQVFGSFVEQPIVITMISITIDEHITLNQIQLVDAAEIFLSIDNQRDYLKKWLPFINTTKNVSDTEKFIKSVFKAPENNQEYTFVIRYNYQFAGIIGYKDTDLTNRKTEIGYWLSESFQGKGIVSKAVKRLIAFTFNDLKMNRLQIKCASGNHKSKRIPQRLKFKLEGVERAGELLSNGEFADLEVYSMLKKDHASEN